MTEKNYSEKLTGLSWKEAAARLKKDGYNELPQSKKRNIFQIAFDVIKEPMFLLLVACGSIYLLLGDKESAIMLLGFVFVIMGITLWQSNKTERALEALKDLSSPRALVIRDGEQRRIAGREVVCGDIIILSEGDRVPADAVVISSSNIMADESLLTGESVTVRKIKWDGKQEIGRAGGDDIPFVYSGTMIVQGQGIALVKATGSDTELGKIGKALESVIIEETLLQKETKKLVKTIAIFGFLVCAAIVIIYGTTRHDWLKGFLAGITLAMALLPEEFPVVLTIFLALGAWRISKKHILTRRVPAVETLGSATVLCVDKTGTLTLNQMEVEKIYAVDKFYDLNKKATELLPETFHELVEFSILASQHEPFDPMEKAIKKLGEIKLSGTEHIHNDWTLAREYPLSKDLLAMSNVWRSPDENEYVIGVKGAAEAIMDLCHINEAGKEEIKKKIDIMANDGLRIIGVAKAYFNKEKLPRNQHDFKFEFLGLIGLKDPVRPTVKGALQECSEAGIRVIMITGDYPGTARNIADQIGLESKEIITGPELETMSAEELMGHLKNTNIFARTAPEQKLKIVEALKAMGEIVAMTGDGVNDAPALKSANIGIAMGARGTDVAREASALVLLEEDFSLIVAAVRMGRRIFDNLKKAMAYIFAVHVPIAGLSLLPVVFNLPLILMPVHIVFLELIIDPVCSIVFERENEEKNIMSRPPRNLKEPMFSKKTIGLSVLQGMGVLLVTIVVYLGVLKIGRSAEEARALTFVTLIFANLCLVLTNRSWTRTIFSTLTSPNGALWLVIALAGFFTGMVLYVPFLRNMFSFSFLHPKDLIVCLIAGFISIGWFEFMKIVNSKKMPQKNKI